MTKLRQILRRYNLSKSHFASLVDVSERSVSKYETGDSTLSQGIATKIRRGLTVLVKYNLVAPSWKLGNNVLLYPNYKCELDKYYKARKEYIANFKHLYKTLERIEQIEQED